MIKLKSLLPTLLSENEGYSTPIDEAATKAFIMEHCQVALAQARNGVCIYRGANEFHNTDQPLLLDPSRNERTTANGASNFYMLYTTDSPHWKSYPRRNYSSICGGYEEASSFGTPRLMLFLGNPKMGAFDDRDFWMSKTIRGGYLSDFINDLTNIFEIGETRLDSHTTDHIAYREKVNELASIFGHYTSENFPSADEALDAAENDGLIGNGNEFSSFLINEVVNGEDFHDSFYHYFTPHSADTSLIHLSDMEDTRGYEIWSEGQALAITPEMFESMFDIRLEGINRVIRKRKIRVGGHD
jgi:hypothetical protein